MNIKEEAQIILDNFSEEQLGAFVTLFKPLVEDKSVFSEELDNVEVELPKWLADKADELGIDLSEVLVIALKKELGIE